MPKVKLGMTVADWISTSIRKKKITQTMYAESLGRKQQTVSRQLKENRVDYEMLQMAFVLTDADAESIAWVMKAF